MAAIPAGTYEEKPNEHDQIIQEMLKTLKSILRTHGIKELNCKSLCYLLNLCKNYQHPEKEKDIQIQETFRYDKLES